MHSMSKFLTSLLLAAFALTLANPAAYAREKIALPSISLPTDIYNGGKPPSSDDNDQECEAQATILKAKSAMSGKCEAPPQSSTESSLKCPDATKSGNTDKDTGGAVTYSQAVRPDLKGKVIDFAPKKTNDCSGNMSATCAAMGWLLEPGKEWTEATTTAELAKILGSEGNECWKKITDEPRAGDMFTHNNGTTGHTGLWFDEKNTWESTNKAGESGPQFVDKDSSSAKSDMSGAMATRGAGGGGIFRFQKKNKRCVGEPKGIKGEEKIMSCKGIENAPKPN